MDIEALRERPDAEIVDAMDQVFGIFTASHATLLELIVVHHEKGGHTADGASSTADWLSIRFRVPPPLAREWVRVALALDELPHLQTAYQDAALTWDQVRVLTRFVTPETDGEWTDKARGMNLAQIESWARHLVRLSNEDAARAHSGRSLRFIREHAAMRIAGRFPLAEAKVVEKALERIMERQRGDDRPGVVASFEARQADALVEMSSMQLAADGDGDRATIVVHVTPDDLRAHDGTAWLDGHLPIPPNVTRRLTCDGSIESVLENAAGDPFGIGHRSRAVPGWLVRQVRLRDEGCRFPGCSHTRWLHAHHKRHWSDGGRTDLDNLVTLCGHHHRVVHDAGWKLRGDPNGVLEFVKPDGSVFRSERPRLRPEVRKRVPVLQRKLRM